MTRINARLPRNHLDDDDESKEILRILEKKYVSTLSESVFEFVLTLGVQGWDSSMPNRAALVFLGRI